MSGIPSERFVPKRIRVYSDGDFKDLYGFEFQRQKRNLFRYSYFSYGGVGGCFTESV